MRILIIGASGLVGGSLYRDFLKDSHQVTGTYHRFNLPGFKRLNVENLIEIEELFSEVKPEVVLSPAAYANVDGCEKNQELCRQVNRDGILNLINSCRKFKARFVFFSSDYVFDGTNGPYTEEDTPNPLNYYGQLKLEIENLLSSSTLKHLIIRTANVYGWESQGKNFVLRLIKTLKEGRQINIVTDQIGSPTYVKSLTESVLHLVKNNKQGIYNVSGSEVCSRYDFSLQIAEVFNLNKDLINPILTSEINQTATRPLKGGLKVTKVQSVLPFPLLNVREGLERMKQEELKMKN